MIALLAARLFHFLVPGGVLLLAGLLFSSNPEILHWRPVVARILQLAVPVVVVFVCWRFNKYKPAFAVLVLLLSEWLLQRFCRGAGIDRQLASQVANSVAVLLPLNLAWLALGRERGLFNLQAVGKLLLLISQPLLVSLMIMDQPEIFLLLDKDILPVHFPVWLGLSQTAFTAYIVALSILFFNLGKKRGAVDTGFIWALVASYFGIAIYSGLLSTICLATAALILAVSVVEAAYSMAYRDDLTGLAGRRALNEMLLRLRGKYVVAMLDIDFFKKFNDSYGHDVGDQVLKMVASRIARVSGGGRAYRYGGEEFTVIFPGRKVEDVTGYLERLRKSVENAGFTLRDSDRPKSAKSGAQGRGSRQQNAAGKVGVTVSIGAAGRNSRTTGSGEVLKKADLALYKAKKSGRNRVVIS